MLYLPKKDVSEGLNARREATCK